METIAKELNETMEGLSEIVSTSKEGDETSEDPSTIIAASNREAKEAYKEYLEFKEKHIKDIKEIKKIQVEIGNSNSEVVEVRKEVPKCIFQSNNAIRPVHLNEDTNLVNIKSWIIDFRNYITTRYNDVIPKKGHYTHMRPIIDKSWAISLDDMEPNNVGLEALCELLMNEAKNRYPLHQRRIQFMKAK